MFRRYRIRRFSKFGLKCLFAVQNFGFGAFLSLNIIIIHMPRALPCVKSRHMSHCALKSVQSFCYRRQQETRKPCCRKETARCSSYSFRLKLAANIHYKFKSSQASKAMLQSSKHSGAKVAKPNLTQNGHLRSFKVTCFGVS